MATASGVVEKLTGLLEKANGATGRQDSTLTGAVDALVAGYGSGTDAPSVTVEQAVPVIEVSSGGLITATATQKAGRVAAGTTETTRQMSTAAAQTVTPGTSEQTAVVAGRYTTGAIKVAGDSNLIPGNIKSGVRIFGVDGTCRSDGGAEAGDLSELHYWEKYVSGSDRVTEASVSDVTLSYQSKVGTNPAFDTVKYSDGITVNGDALALVEPVTTILLDNTNRDQIVGKYIHTTYDGGYYRIPSDAKITYKTSTYASSVVSDKAFKLTAEVGGERLGVVVAANSAAYPEDGDQDGYRYVYMGTLAGTGGGDDGLVMQSGKTTSNVIETGLSRIDAITVYKTAFSGTGLIQVTADFVAGIVTHTYCSNHGTYTQTVVVADGAALAAVDGGTFTWNGSSFSALTADTEYQWFAVGAK